MAPCKGHCKRILHQSACTAHVIDQSMKSKIFIKLSVPMINVIKLLKVKLQEQRAEMSTMCRSCAAYEQNRKLLLGLQRLATFLQAAQPSAVSWSRSKHAEAFRGRERGHSSHQSGGMEAALLIPWYLGKDDHHACLHEDAKVAKACPGSSLGNANAASGCNTSPSDEAVRTLPAP